MTLLAPLTTMLNDRTALLGSTAAALAGMPTPIIACYILGRLTLPALLIIYAAHDATPGQRVALVRAYLLHSRRGASTRTRQQPQTAASCRVARERKAVER